MQIALDVITLYKKAFDEAKTGYGAYCKYIVLPACIHFQAVTNTHTYTHTLAHIYTHSHIHTHMHTHSYTLTHTHTYACTYACIH